MTTTNTIPQVNATVKLNADVNLISLEPFAGKNLKVIKHQKGTICAPIFLLVEDEEGSTIFVQPEYVTEVSDVDQVEGETVAELERKLASIKGNDPAAEGRRAAIKDEIARTMFRTEPTTTHEEPTMTYHEAKKAANKNNPNVLFTGDAGNGCTFEVYYNPLLGRQVWATVMPNGIRVY